ncbi:cytokine receptor [Drosophila pseudoobscura]|uniref:Cytokine receptor n=1 Tax=Drosophila pseudoobscura pseudoobscura TaxID=46245 RepID=Q29HY6_DROPS|nr:cytokine receptor [Drosophila pseudoobscura]
MHTSRSIVQQVLELLALLATVFQQTVATVEPGWLYPDKVEQLIGADFNISCTINETYFRETNTAESCTVDQLYFKSKMQEYRRSPDIRIVNNTTIIFSAREAVEQEDEYRCMCGIYVINTSKVYVGTRPLLIEDFSCVGYDFNYMLCNFTKPQNKIITKYNVSFTVYQKDSRYMYPVDCNFDAAPVVTCNITDESYQKFTKIYYFHLDIRNTLGQEKQIIEVNHFERTVPSRPGQNLTVVNRTESSICLSWEMPRRTNYPRGLTWQVQVTPVNLATLKRNNWRNNSSSIKDTLCLTELPYAGYDYTLRVRVRGNQNNTMWSEPLVYNFVTGPERPRRPPLVTDGSFYVYSSETMMRFYWEPLAPHELNGDDFKYIISEYRVNGSLVDPSVIKVESNSALIEHWNNNANHDILIRSSNSVNASVNATHMSIGPISNADINERVPKNIRSVYHPNNKSYTVSWESPLDVFELTNYTVFWCVAKPALQSECAGSIRFEKVDSRQRQFTTTKDQPPSLHMAVSANYRHHNTGMRWLICSSDKKDDLAKMEPTIDASSNSTLTVKWSTERVCPVILTGYNLTYCQRSAGKPDNCTTEAIEDRDAKQYVIRDLVPYTDYSVKMLMKSETRASKYSDELIKRTGEAAPSQPRELQLHNVSNSSAQLAWKPPLKANGVVRAYEGIFHHDNTTEYFKLPASADELVDKEKLISFELGNLTAYTDYEVSIRARTLYPSEPSNVIRFRTAIGVPSPPTLLVTNNKDQSSRLDWKAPRQPAGLVDYYEISLRDNNSSCLVSYILPGQNRSHVMATPRCTSHNPFQLAVRAINVERLLHTGDLQEVGEANGARPAVSAKSCQVHLDGLGEEDRIAFETYSSNSTGYRLHRSEWGTYGFICTPEIHSVKAMYQTIEVSLAILVLGVIFYTVYKKYRKMSDIDLVLPQGILETLKKPKDMGGLGLSMGPDMASSGGIICTRVDDSPQYTQQDMPHDFSSCGSESSKLLLRNTSSSGGCTDRDDRYDDQTEIVGMNPMTTMNTMTAMNSSPAPPTSYVSMRHGLLVQNDRESESERDRDIEREQQRSSMQEMQANHQSSGYIKPTQMKSWPTSNANTLPGPNVPTAATATQPMSVPLSMARMPLNGYVPVNILKSQPQMEPNGGHRVAPTPDAAAFFVPEHLLNAENSMQAASDLHKLQPLNPASTAAAASPTYLPAISASAAAPKLNVDTGYTTMEQLQRTGMMQPQAFLPAISPSAAPKLNVDTGYTTMEQLQRTGLMKPQALPQSIGMHTSAQPSGGAAAGATTGPRVKPQINGYVTPQDLNALAHNRHVL